MFSRTAALAILSMLPALMPAMAQDQAKEKKEGREEQQVKEPDVIITASRLDEPAKDVASSNTVIPGSDIKKAQHRMVANALKEVPALDLATTGGLGHTTSIFMRGANSGATLVLIDGVEANNPISTDRGYDFANLTTDNIERIEVVRGPQSVLYGSDAMGGVINIITKKGKGELRANLLLEAGSFATYRGSLSAGGGNDLVNVAFSASRAQSAGISAAAKDLGNRERDGYRNETVSAKVGFTPAAWFEIDVVARGTDAEAEIDNFGGVGGDDPNHVMDTTQWLFSVAPRLRLLDNSWEQTLSFSLTNLVSHDDNPPDAETFGTFSFGDFRSQLVTLDWQNTFFLIPDQSLIVGATFRQESGESTNLFQNFAPPPDVIVDVLSNQTAWIRSAYGQYRIHLLESIIASAGARVDDHKAFGTHGTYRGTLAYLAKCTDTKFRGTVGTGFKAPSLYQLFSSFGDPDLKPEESLGWDAGFDQGFLDGTVTASVTYFKNNFTNLIDFDTATSTYNNIGRARTSGVEAAIRIALLKELEVRLSYTFTDTENKDTGEQLLRRAPHKGGVRVLYSPIDALKLNASVLYVGKRKELDFSAFPAPMVTLDDYILVDLAASLRVHKHVELFIRGENIANQKYEDSLGFGVPGPGVYAGANIDF